MCDPVWSEVLSVGAMQAGKAYMQYDAQNHNFEMAKMARKSNNATARRSSQLQREKVRAENHLRSRNRMGNLFEIEKERIKRTGAANASASAEGRAGNSVDRAIFDIYQDADQNKGAVESDYQMGIRLSMHTSNAIAESLRAQLLGNMNTESPGDTSALLMNIASAGLGAYNHYKSRQAEREKAIVDSAS